MRAAALAEVARYCDRVLRVGEFADWEGVYNGLQVGNRGRVTRLAAAVDASLATVRRALELGADLLLVHHGLLWGPNVPWVGGRRELMRLLLEHDLALYSSHLPLDAHPELGNNVLLARALGFRRLRPFFLEKGRRIGWRAATRVGREDLAVRLEKVVGHPPRVVPAGPAVCRRVGVVSGGAGEGLRRAAAEGVDTLVTGEGPHWTWVLAQELGANVLYGGHYATETFGVKALAARLSRRFGLPWAFVDDPSGL